MRGRRWGDDHRQGHCHCVDVRHGCLHGCCRVDQWRVASHLAARACGYGSRRSNPCRHYCRQASCQHSSSVRRRVDHHRDRHVPVVASYRQQGAAVLRRRHGNLREGQASWRGCQLNARYPSYSHAHRPQQSSSRYLHGPHARCGQCGGHIVQAHWAVRS